MSVSHARGVSAAFAWAVRDGIQFGIDLEAKLPERPRIARRVLTPRELEALGSWSPWPEVLRVFCMKEAAYKALPREQQLGVTFRSLEVEQNLDTGDWMVRRVRDGIVVAAVSAAANCVLVVAVAASVCGA
ncbi:4'-phosphopantetheinyl transferase superfamily protein [Sorangium sp. So ce1182]|uniref:4'-phosphopantetheinyl transferase superfamily protein n=1 Tax=Sorangium sp. So ce1182 TaxID=3133334 RepID=UPI003F61235E